METDSSIVNKSKEFTQNKIESIFDFKVTPFMKIPIEVLPDRIIHYYIIWKKEQDNAKPYIKCELRKWGIIKPSNYGNKTQSQKINERRIKHYATWMNKRKGVEDIINRKYSN